MATRFESYVQTMNELSKELVKIQSDMDALFNSTISNQAVFDLLSKQEKAQALEEVAITLVVKVLVLPYIKKEDIPTEIESFADDYFIMLSQLIAANYSISKEAETLVQKYVAISQKTELLEKISDNLTEKIDYLKKINFPIKYGDLSPNELLFKDLQ